MKKASDTAQARKVSRALRIFAEHVYRWSESESRSIHCAGRTRGDVLVIAATGYIADRIEGTLLREGLLEQVQRDRPEHLDRTKPATYTTAAATGDDET